MEWVTKFLSSQVYFGSQFCLSCLLYVGASERTAQNSVCLTTEARHLPIIKTPITQIQKEKALYMAPVSTSALATSRSSGKSLNMPARIALGDPRERLVPFSLTHSFTTRSFPSLPFLSRCYKSLLHTLTYLHVHAYVRTPRSTLQPHSTSLAPLG